MFATNKLEYFKQGQNDPGGNVGFDAGAAMAFTKQELEKVSKYAAAYDDVFADNSSFYKDAKTGYLLDIPYIDVGIDPIGLDLNGDGVINENEYATLIESDKDKVFKGILESDEFSDLYANWAAKKFEQVYNKGVKSGETVLDKKAEADIFDPNDYKTNI